MTLCRPPPIRFRPHPAMITCVIVLALLTVLVATEPGPDGRETHP